MFTELCEQRLTRRAFLTRTGVLLGSAIISTGVAACDSGSMRRLEPTKIVPTEVPKKEVPVKDISSEELSRITWNKLKDASQRRHFTQRFANQYVNLTRTSRLTAETIEKSTTYYLERTEFERYMKDNYPGHNLPIDQWGNTNLLTGEVTVCLETLNRIHDDIKMRGIDFSAGEVIAGGLLHEWTRLDVVPRKWGQLINNPQYRVYSSKTKEMEMFKFYYGVGVAAETTWGYLRFESVVVSTIALLRLIQQINARHLFATSANFKNGTDVLVNLVLRKLNLQTFYEHHATSDFEGLVSSIGAVLPGSTDPLDKGLLFALAVENNNTDLMVKTGIFDIVTPRVLR